MACMTLAQAVPSVAGLENCKRCVTFGGKAAEQTQQAASLRATANCEKDSGRAPKIKDPCQKLDLMNTFIPGARGQDILGELYTVTNGKLLQ